MNRLINKHGIELGINAIIIIALALIALVIIVAFFFGGFSALGGSVGIGRIGMQAETEAEKVDVGGAVEGVEQWGCPEGQEWHCVDNNGNKYTGSEYKGPFITKTKCQSNNGHYYNNIDGNKVECSQISSGATPWTCKCIKA